MLKQYKLKKLLEDSYEKYYWLGFLLADGHFEEKRLSISLSIKDLQHLEKLKTYLDAPINIRKNFSKCDGKMYEYCKLSVMDSLSIPILKKQYFITNKKTYEPPNLLNIPDDFLFCLFIGFIDGDGCIQKQTGREDCKITIKCHKNWKNFLALFNKNIKITKCGRYAYIIFSNSIDVINFKNRALQMNLPIMSRKWDRIDVSKISRYWIAAEWHPKALQLYVDGKTINEISKILNKKYTTVYKVLRRKYVSEQT